jgi:hypothetical protein
VSWHRMPSRHSWVVVAHCGSAWCQVGAADRPGQPCRLQGIPEPGVRRDIRQD